MRKQTRTKLFAAFVGIFLLLTPALVLYAQGYRVDLDAFRIVKTGAIYVQARPYPVELSVEGKKKKETNFLFRNVFTANLLPRPYTVDIAKEGYHPWQKALAVEAGLVTETSRITLFPKNPERIEVASSADEVFHSPDTGSSIVTYTDKKSGGRALGLYVRGEETIQEAISLLYRETIHEVVWSHDNTRMLMVLLRPGANPRFLIGSVKEPRTFSFITIPSPWIIQAVRESNMHWQWSNDNALLYFAVRNNLYSIDLVQKQIAGPLRTAVQDIRVFPEGIVMLHTTGMLSRYTHSLEYVEEYIKYGEEEAPVDAQSIIGTYEVLLLRGKDALYALDREQKHVTRISTGMEIEEVAVSPDGENIAFAMNQTVYVYWLKDMINGFARTRGDIEKIVSSTGALGGISWLFSPYQYIAIATDQELMITEIDTRDRVNVVRYPDFASSRPIAWNKNTDSLLVLTQNALQEIALTKADQTAQ